MKEEYEIKVKYEGELYTILLKNIKPKKTIVKDSKDIVYNGIARKLLREKALQLNYPGIDSKGAIYSNGIELITHEYIRRLSKYKDK